MRSLWIAVLMLSFGVAYAQTSPEPLPAPPPQQTIPAPTTLPGTQPQQGTTELRNLEVEFQKALDQNKRQIDQLRNQIAQLRNNAGTSDLEKLRSRIDLLEQLNEQRQTNSKRLDQIRFETGKGILKVLVEKSAALQVASGLGATLSGFQRSLNPMSDTTFVSEVTKLTSNLKDGNDAVVGATHASGLLANPYVSLAVSIASVFVSRYRPADKVAHVRDMVCVADFTSKAAPDLQYIDNTIKNLDERVRSFNALSKQRFRTYAATVGYDHTWDEYQQDKLAQGEDPVTTLTVSFFDNLPTPATPVDPIAPALSRLRYQVENVKSYVAEYESLISQIDDFYNSFAAIVERDAALGPAANTLCAANVSIVRVQAELKELLPKVKLAKSDFRTAYSTSIPPESRRVLFSIE